MRKKQHSRKRSMSLMGRMIIGALILLVLYLGWIMFWPKMMGFLTAHKTRNIPTELYNSRFADMNPVQLEAAQRYGITPVDDRSFEFDGCKKLTRIEDCTAYSLANLTHSVPYLTHAAADLLKEIGEEY